MAMAAVGVAMLAGGVFGAAYGAAKSGDQEAALIKQITEVQNQTETMQSNINKLVSATSQIKTEAIINTVNAGEEITKLDDSISGTMQYFSGIQTTMSINGIVLCVTIMLLLFAKLLIFN